MKKSNLLLIILVLSLAILINCSKDDDNNANNNNINIGPYSVVIDGIFQKPNSVQRTQSQNEISLIFYFISDSTNQWIIINTSDSITGNYEIVEDKDKHPSLAAELTYRIENKFYHAKNGMMALTNDGKNFRGHYDTWVYDSNNDSIKIENGYFDL